MNSTRQYREEERLDRKEKRKEEIVNSAWKLFLDNGFGETTMANIAYEAKISRKTLYQYFNSKEEITFEIEIKLFKTYNKIMEDLLPNLEGTGYEKLIKYFEVVDTNLDKFKDAIKFTGIFDYNIKPNYPNIPLIEKFMGVIKQSNSYLENIIAEGVDDGSIKKNIDSKLTANTISDSWLCLSHKIFNRKENLDKIQDTDSRLMITHQMNLFLEALKNDE